MPMADFPQMQRNAWQLSKQKTNYSIFIPRHNATNQAATLASGSLSVALLSSVFFSRLLLLLRLLFRFFSSPVIWNGTLYEKIYFDVAVNRWSGDVLLTIGGGRARADRLTVGWRERSQISAEFFVDQH
uniref:Uncharacterized protein n=1 Tax=Romanomermis culicivorax TaxID=13658 RepID=A0A915IJ75_ROMCU